MATRGLERQVRSRHKNCNLIFARIKEESVCKINWFQEDKVCITGLAGEAYAQADNNFSEGLVSVFCGAAALVQSAAMTWDGTFRLLHEVGPSIGADLYQPL